MLGPSHLLSYLIFTVPFQYIIADIIDIISNSHMKTPRLEKVKFSNDLLAQDRKMSVKCSLSPKPVFFLLLTLLSIAEYVRNPSLGF